MTPDPSGARWLVLYDDRCAWCVWSLDKLLLFDRRRRFRPVGLHTSEAAGLLHDLGPEERLASWHVISPTADRYSAGAAIGPLLRRLPAGRLPAAAFDRLPTLSERGYRLVADHRARLSRLVSTRASLKAAERLERSAGGPGR